MTPQQQPQQQQQQQQSSPENLVVVKMGVEELRALITDVVQKAVEGLRAAEGGDSKAAAVKVSVEAGADGVLDKDLGFRDEEGEGDEIVVAGSFVDADVENQNHDFSPMKED
jgi:hypothetical protein